MRPINRETWRFDAAQTNVVLKAVAANLRPVITLVIISAKDSNSADVDISVGVGPGTIAEPVVNSTTGRSGIAFTHPGVGKGSVVGATMAGESLATGEPGWDIVATFTNPTGGSIDISVGWREIDDSQ
jgi:hypothetical protein